jgi:hypothetical protein
VSLSIAAGYVASVLVVLAFCMKDMTALRLVALGSNVTFLIYGIGLGLVPVWLLHAILLPINGWRLWQAIWQQPPTSRPALGSMSFRKSGNNQGGLPCV